MDRPQAVSALANLIANLSNVLPQDADIIAENLVDFFDDIHVLGELARKELKKSPFVEMKRT